MVPLLTTAYLLGDKWLWNGSQAAISAACCCDSCPPCDDVPDTIYADVTNCGTTYTITLTKKTVSCPGIAEYKVWEGSGSVGGGRTFSLRLGCCRLENPAEGTCFSWQHNACAGSLPTNACPPGCGGADPEWRKYVLHSTDSLLPPTPCGCPLQPMTVIFYW